MTKRRIAVVGTGIAGLTSAYLLSRRNDVTVFEANDYIGGHTATKTVSVDKQQYQIDTGFIVYNDWTYPNFIRLLERLDVRSQPTEMSFSVHCETSKLEYNGNNLNSLFAQRRNLFKPRFWRLVKDIVAFNKACKQLIANKEDVSGRTLSSLIEELKLSPLFSTHYILPMCAAIWSSSLAQAEKFPLQFFLQFFNNHGLLNINHRPQWRTIAGGSSQYIEPLIKPFADNIKLSTAIAQVETTNEGVILIDDARNQYQFDDVVLACHSDQALSMLKNNNAAYQDILGSMQYANNDVVLHTDTSLLPDRKLAWASWNYRLKQNENRVSSAPASVTYNMNILQRLDTSKTFCVTLNDSASIKPETILGSYCYSHPQFSQKMIQAQLRKEEICGKQNIYFCGAYWYNGFHEDGVRSALDVCKKFGEDM
ncbi:NAD(P)/FAD-dependent oxidoreductase [Alteromonas ponticola]|uniref:FAD-dependent oxidoreductase n=1 Tax=Alteromonas ponticola TaxID=2720613 RepID=A0ABX1QXD8_9ALTE|nr:FAD-dependent oxidoreductase [Alteromonas ponticola]NMH58904.1 FAD-dependent oxidoreductase [Alteromonas ponticola]